MIENQVCEPLQEAWYYVDEPTYFHFHTSILANSDLAQVVSGGALTQASAQRKTVFEAFERYCVSVPLDAFGATVGEIEKGFPITRLPRLEDVQNSQRLRVVEGAALSSGRHALVPVQLVNVPYSASGEPLLREPISTGAAAGDSRNDAIVRGLLECIERDAVIASFYTRTCRSRVEVESHDSFIAICDELNRCKLDLSLIDVSCSELTPHTFLALLVDDTGFGPALTAGAKCGFDPAAVALGAIEEAIHLRGWLRDQLADEDGSFDQRTVVADTAVHTFLDRARAWSPLSSLGPVDFYRRATQRPLADYENLTSDTDRELAQLCSDLERVDAPAFVVDLSARFSWAAQLPASVVKVVTPTLQPLFIDERHRLLSVERLARLGSICDSPTHFFL